MLFWGWGLLAAAMLLIIIEVFVPSGGLIAIVAGVVSIAGVVVLFRFDTTWGLIGILCVLFAGPTVFGFALKVWPNTPIGRKMLHGEVTEEQLAEREMRSKAERERWQSLLGAEGTAITDLRPVGRVELEGERYDALSEAGLIERGAPVRVTRVEGTQIKVRRLT